MVILTPIERETLQFFLHISQMLNLSTFGNTTDIYAIVRLVPHACQHITVVQSHSSGDAVAKIWRLAGVEAQRQCQCFTKTVSVLHKDSVSPSQRQCQSFTNAQKKNCQVVKSGNWGGHRINASSFFP